MSASPIVRRIVTRLVSRITTTVEPAGELQTRPRVSVIVLCYKYGRFLPAAVRSVLEQRGVDVEVIIVDDASPDDSGQVAREISMGDPRVTAMVLSENVGPVAAFNLALPHVSGKYLVRLDADDELTPGALVRATALLETHPEVAFVYGRPRHFHGDGLPPAHLQPTSWSIWNGIDWLKLRCKLGVNCMTSPEVVIRTSLQRQLGGQLEELGHTHDMEMWLRAARHGAVGRVNDVDQAFVRIHSESRMRTLFKSQLLDLEERCKAFELALNRTVGQAVEGLPETARISLANEAIDLARHAYERNQTEKEPVAGYIQLAGRVWPPILQTRAMSGLRMRQRVGPALAPWVPHYFLSAAVRGVRRRIAFRYWRWSGL